MNNDSTPNAALLAAPLLVAAAMLAGVAWTSYHFITSESQDSVNSPDQESIASYTEIKKADREYKIQTLADVWKREVPTSVQLKNWVASFKDDPLSKWHENWYWIGEYFKKTPFVDYPVESQKEAETAIKYAYTKNLDVALIDQSNYFREGVEEGRINPDLEDYLLFESDATKRFLKVNNDYYRAKSTYSSNSQTQAQFYISTDPITKGYVGF